MLLFFALAFRTCSLILGVTFSFLKGLKNRSCSGRSHHIKLSPDRFLCRFLVLHPLDRLHVIFLCYLFHAASRICTANCIHNYLTSCCNVTYLFLRYVLCFLGKWITLIISRYEMLSLYNWRGAIFRIAQPTKCIAIRIKMSVNLGQALCFVYPFSTGTHEADDEENDFWVPCALKVVESSQQHWTLV